MSWTVRIDLDVQSTRSGVVTATWDRGGSAEFVYGERADTASFSPPEFKARVTAARDAALSRRAAVSAKATAIESILNG